MRERLGDRSLLVNGSTRADILQERFGDIPLELFLVAFIRIMLLVKGVGRTKVHLSFLENQMASLP